MLRVQNFGNNFDFEHPFFVGIPHIFEFFEDVRTKRVVGLLFVVVQRARVETAAFGHLADGVAVKWRVPATGTGHRLRRGPLLKVRRLSRGRQPVVGLLLARWRSRGVGTLRRRLSFDGATSLRVYGEIGVVGVEDLLFGLHADESSTVQFGVLSARGWGILPEK